MTATKPRTADRLTFSWQPTFDQLAPIAVEVTETRARSAKVSRYLVDKAEELPGGTVFLVLNDDSGEVYETYLSDDGDGYCSCKGSSCRNHEIKCRHQLLCRHLTDECAV
jgi:hypothetical protein